MGMSHKAYAFDWHGFEFDLHPWLEAALAADNPAELESFIDDNRASVTDPYEGDPLPEDWRAGLENRDVHEFGDYALTRFYDPADDCGVGSAWMSISNQLPEAAANALLGFSVGPPGRLFDPGRYGSYFQTPAQVRESLAVLKPLDVPELARFVELLERCAAEGRACTPPSEQRHAELDAAADRGRMFAFRESSSLQRPRLLSLFFRRRRRAMIRMLFVAITSVVGLGCVGYALWLSQSEWSSDRSAERRVRPSPEAGIVSFALAGGLCVLSAAVVLNGRREERV